MARVIPKPPESIVLRFCPTCGRISQDSFPKHHNPSWPDASPYVCEGPVQTLTYKLEVQDG